MSCGDVGPSLDVYVLDLDIDEIQGVSKTDMQDTSRAVLSVGLVGEAKRLWISCCDHVASLSGATA